MPLGPLTEDPANPILLETERQLGEYFAGRLKAFNVPFGETRSYGEIARRIGKPSASRAMGAANGRNPISIIAPCHRVVGSNGELTGFAGSLAAKQRLLEIESGKAAA